MSKILIIHYGRLLYKGCTDGTSLRVLDLAKRLRKKGHEVTIAETDHKKNFEIKKTKILGFNKITSNKLIKNQDLIMLSPSPIFYKYTEVLKNKPLVIDLYDPILINDLIQKNKLRFSDHLLYISKILSEGDYFICANEKQKNYYFGMLSILGKLNPKNNNIIISTIPPKISEDKLPKNSKTLYKGKIFDKNKKMLLWPGLLYSWYDAITPIKAMQLVKKEIPNAVLVFVGSNHYRYPEDSKKNFKNAKAKAQKLNLLNKNIFFTKWLPYDKRYHMYLESELAIVTCKPTVESKFSFRNRILDCIWGELPIICTSGDNFSEAIEKNKLGYVVKPSNYKMLAQYIIKLLKDENRIKILKSNVQEYKKILKGKETFLDLNKFCNNPKKNRTKTFLTSLELIQQQQKILENQKLKLEILNNKILFIKKRFEKELQQKDEYLQKEAQRFKKELQQKDEYLQKELQQKDEYLQKEAQRFKKELQQKDNKLKQNEIESGKKDKELHAKNLELKRIYESKGYKLLSRFWTLQNFFKKSELKIYHPSIMILSINTRCNLDCTFCDIKDKTKEINYENAKRAIDSGKKIGIKTIVITGGEPFLHPRIFDIIHYSKSKELTVNITTNGTLIKSQIEKIKESKIDSISVSIDGLKETHDRLRRGKGTFDSALEGLKILKKETPTRLLIYFVVTNQNIKQLKKIYELSRKLDVEFNFWPVNNQPRFYLKKEKEIKEYQSFIYHLSRIDSRVKKWEEYYLKAIEYHNKDSIKVRCLGLKDYFGIDWEGNLVPCCLWGKKELIIGNILKQDIKKLITSKKAQYIRDKIFHQGCTNCYNHALAEFKEKTGLPFILQ